jgi:hypothetical protein
LRLRRSCTTGKKIYLPLRASELEMTEEDLVELKKELEAAKKLPAVTGYDEEQKNYYSFLSSVESFMKDMQKARDKGAYSDADYNAMSEAYEYGLSVI